MAFTTILIPQLQQPEAEIKATLEQGSWIGESLKILTMLYTFFPASLFVIGDLFGSVLGGPLADR